MSFVLRAWLCYCTLHLPFKSHFSHGRFERSQLIFALSVSFRALLVFLESKERYMENTGFKLYLCSVPTRRMPELCFLHSKIHHFQWLASHMNKFCYMPSKMRARHCNQLGTFCITCCDETHTLSIEARDMTGQEGKENWLKMIVIVVVSTKL